jgi:hypothetical protein
VIWRKRDCLNPNLQRWNRTLAATASRMQRRQGESVRLLRTATSDWSGDGERLHSRGCVGRLRHARHVQHHRNAGWPTGRESQGHGVLVVVCGGESLPRGEGGQVDGILKGEGCEMHTIPDLSGMSSTGELLDIERVTSSSEGGRWKSTHRGNSLAAYPTARTVTTGGMGRHSTAVRPVPTHWDAKRCRPLNRGRMGALDSERLHPSTPLFLMQLPTKDRRVFSDHRRRLNNR